MPIDVVTVEQASDKDGQQGAEDAWLVYDLDGAILDANESVCALLGFSRADLLTRTIAELRPDAPVELLRQGWAAIVAYGVAHTEVRWTAADGVARLLAVTAELRQRDPVRIQARVRLADAAPPELIRSRRYLLQLMDSLRDCLFVVDVNSGRLLDVNQATVVQTGFSRSALLRMSIADLRVPEERQSVPVTLAAARDRTSPGEPYRVTWLCSDGRRVPMEGSLHRAVLGDGPVLVGTARDISERLAAQELVALANARYRGIFESAREAIFRTSGRGAFEAANPATASLLGDATPEQLMQAVTAIDQLFVDPRRCQDLRALLASSCAADEFEVELLRADGSSVWVSLRIHVTEQGNRDAGLQGTAVDITARRQAESYRYQALHDPLTGLANRALFAEQLEQLLGVVQARRGSLAVLTLDLDGFKTINDTHGHAAGDAVLHEVALRLQAVVRQADVVARLGGDEFSLLLPGTGIAGSIVMAEKLLAALQTPILVDGASMQVGASLGIAVYPDHGRRSAQLLRQADAAMYDAKLQRRGYTVARGSEDPPPVGRAD